MRRVDGQRRQDGEDLRQERLGEEAAVLVLERIAGDDLDPGVEHLRLQVRPDRLLPRHQFARVRVDQVELLCGRQPVGGRVGVARLLQLAQAGESTGTLRVRLRLVDMMGQRAPLPAEAAASRASRRRGRPRRRAPSRPGTYGY